MSNVTLKNYHIICLEYRQEREDEDYGLCLWARFYFNLDKYELVISSDCGSYGYKWGETDSESFLHLMSKCSGSYILNKIARQDVFDFEATKDALYYDPPGDNEEKELNKKLDKIFNAFEYEPETGSDFVRMFDEENDGTFIDTFEMPVYGYPYSAVKIAEIFNKHIRPKIKEILRENEALNMEIATKVRENDIL